MTDTPDPSVNKFTRLFKDRAIAIAQAKPQVRGEGSPVAKAIAAAAARALAAEDDVLEAEVIAENPALAPAKPAAIGPAAPSANPPAQLQPKAKHPLDPHPATPRKRGRPANGKRSDPGWHSRTFYIRKQTDDRLERAIQRLKRSGIEVDKSQLADALLNAWAAVELDEAADMTIGTIIAKPAPKTDQ